MDLWREFVHAMLHDTGTAIVGGLFVGCALTAAIQSFWDRRRPR